MEVKLLILVQLVALPHLPLKLLMTQWNKSRRRVRSMILSMRVINLLPATRSFKPRHKRRQPHVPNVTPRMLHRNTKRNKLRHNMLQIRRRNSVVSADSGMNVNRHVMNRRRVPKLPNRWNVGDEPIWRSQCPRV